MFSIATPTRNALEPLKRCVGSVRAQRDVAVEHCVQDCVSEDGTPEWLARQQDLNWRSEPDRGMYDAITRAWSRSSGRFLSWLNADEQYLPETLARVKALFDARPEVDAAFGDYIICDADSGWPLAARREIPLRRRYVVNGVLYAASCTLFFRRRLLDEGMLELDRNLRDVADAKLVVGLLDGGKRIVHLPAYLALFGASGANMSTGANALREAAAFRREHGRFRSPVWRRAVRCLRWLEKAARGCYGARRLHYRFCTDAEGGFREISAPRVGTRWRLGNA